MVMCLFIITKWINGILFATSPNNHRIKYSHELQDICICIIAGIIHQGHIMLEYTPFIAFHAWDLATHCIYISTQSIFNNQIKNSLCRYIVTDG